MTRRSSPANQKNGLVQYQIVVLALYSLDGHSRRVDTEDVAIKAHELAPMRFAWAKHPDQVNIELVRVALSDAKKPEKGRLIAGSGKTGWSLTPAGLAWAQQVAPSFTEPMPLEAGRSHGSKSPQVIRRDKERTRVLASKPWSDWVGGNRQLALRDVRELLRIDSYTDDREASDKATRLLALLGDDPELSAFLREVAAVAMKEKDKSNA